MNAAEDILNFSPIRQKTNHYPRKEKNCGNDYSIVILYEYHLGGTIIDGNPYLVPILSAYWSTNWRFKIRDLIRQNRTCHKYHLSQNY